MTSIPPSPTSSFTESTPPVCITLSDRLIIFFFAIFFFLCSADQFFSVRIHGLNFRCGQILILVLGLFSFWRLFSKDKTSTAQKEFHWALLKDWTPFFVAYGLAAFTSGSVAATTLKWIWGIFNIGFAALVCSNDQWRKNMETGIKYGVLTIAIFLWIQALYLDWFDGVAIINGLHASNPIIVPGSIPFLGYAQSFWKLSDTQLYRPNIFYYEPSYAGCALSFGFALVLLFQKQASNFKAIFFPAVVLSAIILTSARSGILTVIVILFCIIFQSILQRNKIIPLFIFKIILLAGLMIAIFCLTNKSREFIGILLGPLSPNQALHRLGDAKSPEGGRLADILNGLHLWSQHPLLGNGIPESRQSGLGQTCVSTWVALGVESGFLGVFAFLWAVSNTMWHSLKKSVTAQYSLIILISAWFSHFVMNLNLTGTYPRLDYWILFFISISILRPNPQSPNS